jgi:hypothetical protein
MAPTEGSKGAQLTGQLGAGLSRDTAHHVSGYLEALARRTLNAPGTRSNDVAFDRSKSAPSTSARHPEAERAPFRPAFPGDTEPPLTRRNATIERVVRTREGTAENPAEGTIRWLEQQIATLSAQATADKTRQDKIKAIQTRISAINTEIKRIWRTKGSSRGRGTRDNTYEVFLGRAALLWQCPLAERPRGSARPSRRRGNVADI